MRSGIILGITVVVVLLFQGCGRKAPLTLPSYKAKEPQSQAPQGAASQVPASQPMSTQPDATQPDSIQTPVIQVPASGPPDLQSTTEPAKQQGNEHE